tara:strand:+ start:605 stop:1687 length:1083 start_codon:yes stop_codon:yes gene_type:complete
MIKTFNIAEDTITTQITVTNGFFDGGVGTVSNATPGASFTTSSLSATQKSYYYNLQYNSKDHFSLTYGHIAGSGSAVETATQEGTTQAIYKQFFNFVENKAENLRDGTGWIMIDGTDGTNAVTQSDVYILSAERLQMKDRLNPGTWTVTLSGSIKGGAHGSGSFIKLTDDSKTEDPDAAPFGPRYHIVSGTAGTVHTAYTTKTFGFFYPDAGLMVFSANALSASLPGSPGFINSGSGYGLKKGNGFAPDTRVVAAADNANKLRVALQKGDVTLRSEERQYIYDYFCRAKASEFNLSQNITFWSGSDYKMRHNDMVTNPQTFISEVGLYDNQNSLMAIGRISSAINKNFSSEAIVKVRLTY